MPLTPRTEPPTDPAPRLTTGRVVVLLTLAALFGYYNSLHGAFVFDDMGMIVNDPALGRPLAGRLAAGRPVASLSFTANYLLDGLNVRGYHLVNLVVHLAAGVVLYALVRRTLLLDCFAGRFAGRAEVVAMAIAVLWFLHPIQTQSVTYIVQRCESMMGLFFLASLYCFVRGATSGGRGWYAGAVGCCALGAGCKEMTLALPPLALLYDRTFLAGTWREALRRRWAVYLLLCIPPAVGAAYLLGIGLFSDPAGTVGFGVKRFTPTTYALTQTEVVLYYLQLIAWPHPLCLDYIDWPAPKTLADCWPTAAGLAALLAATAVGVWRRTWWGFLGAWYFLILAPTSSIIPLQDPAFEHRLYLPLAAVIALAVGTAVGGIDFVARRYPAAGRVLTRGAVVFVGALAVVYGFCTVLRNEDYASPMRMWSDVAAKRPANFRARGTVATELLQAGRIEEAQRELAAAEALFPDSPTTALARAFLLLELGHTDRAADVFARIAAARPNDAAVRLWLGICRHLQGRPAEALEQLGAAAERAPGDRLTRVVHGAVLLRAGRPADADREFAAAGTAADYPRQLIVVARRLALDPDAGRGKLGYALLTATAASRMTGDARPEYLDTLALLLARLGRYPEAAEKAAAAARAADDPYHAGRLAKRADLFRRNKPYLPD